MVLVGLLHPLVLLFDYLIRSSLELYQLVCNGHNFPLIGKLPYIFAPSFGSMYYEEHICSGEGYWCWLGCYSPWFHYLTRSLPELYKILCNVQNYPYHWEMNMYIYIIL
jgi:hypothetical protein